MVVLHVYLALNTNFNLVQIIWVAVRPVRQHVPVVKQKKHRVLQLLIVFVCQILAAVLMVLLRQDQVVLLIMPTFARLVTVVILVLIQRVFLIHAPVTMVLLILNLIVRVKTFALLVIPATTYSVQLHVTQINHVHAQTVLLVVVSYVHKITVIIVLDVMQTLYCQDRSLVRVVLLLVVVLEKHELVVHHRHLVYVHKIHVLVPMVMLQQEHRVVQTMPTFARRATTVTVVLRVLRLILRTIVARAATGQHTVLILLLAACVHRVAPITTCPVSAAKVVLLRVVVVKDL